MAKGRELKGRIKSVENTRKITRTMEMVATSKMKRAQDRVVAARPYALALGEVLAGLYSPDLAEHFPLMRQPDSVRRAAVLLLTSNRGLAGAFNSNLIREARRTLARLEEEGVETELHVVGRKGIGYFRYEGRPLATSRTDVTDRPTAADAATELASLNDAVLRAEEDLRVQQERYRLGSGSSLEVSEAQNAVTRAEGDYVNAVYEYHKAVALLELAVGRPLRQ